MQYLISKYQARFYELYENFRSKSNLVTFANSFVNQIPHRMKHNPIVSHQPENGSLRITYYLSLIHIYVRHKQEFQFCTALAHQRQLRMIESRPCSGLPFPYIGIKDIFHSFFPLFGQRSSGIDIIRSKLRIDFRLSLIHIYPSYRYFLSALRRQEVPAALQAFRLYYRYISRYYPKTYDVPTENAKDRSRI